MGILSRFFGKPLKAEVENCIRGAGMVIAVLLIGKYRPQYGEQAAALASAVTNELFGAPPGNETGRQFLAANKQIVDTHLRELANESQICEIVSMLAHTKFNIAGNTASITPDMLMWVSRLRDFGILLPVEQVALPSSPDEMRERIRQFELWSLQTP